MKKLFQILCLLCWLTPIFSQQAGNYAYDARNRTQHAINTPTANAVLQQDNVMILDVKGLMNKKADSYLAIFNLVQVGATAIETDDLVNQRVKALSDELLKHGIPAGDIFVDMVSFVPVYEYQVEKRRFSKNFNEVPAGFELQKNIHIRYKDARKLDKIVSAAARNEIYDLIKVEYFVKDTDEVYHELRKEAIEFAQRKLKDYADLGVELDTVYHVIAEQKSSTFPIDRYQQYQAVCRASLDAVKKRQTVNNIRQPKTMFYHKMPYEQYDIILNAEIMEPVVQYTYNLKIKYIIKERSPLVQVKREKEFIMLTPDGTMKTLKVDSTTN